MLLTVSCFFAENLTLAALLL